MVFGISNTPSIQPEQVEDSMENGYLLIDVREDDEWQAGHHINASHIKMGEIPSNLENNGTYNNSPEFSVVWMNLTEINQD